MSEQREEPLEVGDGKVEEGREVDHELPEEDEEVEPGEEDDDDDSEAAARLKRAEKQAHDKAGLAAKERSRRRAVERELGDMRAQIERLQAKSETQETDEFSALVAALRDDDDEPITDINQIKKALKTFLATQQQRQQGEAQQQQVVQTIRSISSGMDAAEKDFAEDHPDYVEAATFYRNARISELEDLGFTGDRLMQKLAGEFFQMTNDLLKSGRDPAEAVYNLAKKRGFASGKTAATAKLQKLQQAGATQAAPRGRGADNGLTWGEVAKLSGAARDKAFAKLRSREMGKT